MTFAVWNEKPPFGEADLSPGEMIVQVGDKWVVTDKLARATQAEVDAVLNPPAPSAPTPEQKLAAAGLTAEDLHTILGL